MTSNHSAKFWVRTMIGLLALLTLVYGLAHDPPRGAPPAPWQISGRDRVKLGVTERSVISHLLQSGRKLAPCDTTHDHQYNCPATFANNPHRTAVLTYIGMNFRNWMRNDSLLQCQVLDVMSEQEVDDYLVNAGFTLHSFFWLLSWRTMLEVIFWTLFGVLCRILYSMFLVNRAYSQAKANDPSYDPDPENRGFDPGEIYNHMAQLAFAPFVSVILTLGFQFFLAGDATDVVETSTGMLITSFLLGFYSSRALGLLQRIRDVLLPVDSGKDRPMLPPPAPIIVKQLAAPTLLDIPIHLTLSPALAATHTDEHDLEVLNDQLGVASVQLTPAAGGATITATHDGVEQEGGFIAKRVPVGTYTITAKVSTPVGINLKGNATIDLSNATSAEVLMERDGNDG
jgi:hypothetical protein